MASRASRGRIPPWIRLALSIVRVLRIVMLAVAAAIGAPQPKFPRHEDAVVQVAEEDEPKD